MTKPIKTLKIKTAMPVIIQQQETEEEVILTIHPAETDTTGLGEYSSFSSDTTLYFQMKTQPNIKQVTKAIAEVSAALRQLEALRDSLKE